MFPQQIYGSYGLWLRGEVDFTFPVTVLLMNSVVGDKSTDNSETKRITHSRMINTSKLCYVKVCTIPKLQLQKKKALPIIIPCIILIFFSASERNVSAKSCRALKVNRIYCSQTSDASLASLLNWFICIMCIFPSVFDWPMQFIRFLLTCNFINGGVYGNYSERFCIKIYDVFVILNPDGFMS